MKVASSLAEDKYFYGLSALINSMVKNGKYFDKLIVGYRGNLPSWLPKLSSSKNGQFFLMTCGMEIEFIEVKGNLHMVHEKPAWLYHLITELEPFATEYAFFDADIIIINRMSFFGEWLKEGVAISEDVNAHMPDNHPIRLQWQRMASDNGLLVQNKLNRYYNSGFLAWKKSDSGFIKDWLESFRVLSMFTGDMKQFRVNDRTVAVLTANQDSLNLACMVTNFKLSTIGPEAMGFIYGLDLMAHSIGIKPWEQNYFIEFLKGQPPKSDHLHFWKNVRSTELHPFSSIYANYKFWLCKLLKGLSRFYKTF